MHKITLAFYGIMMYIVLVTKRTGHLHSGDPAGSSKQIHKHISEKRKTKGETTP